MSIIHEGKKYLGTVKKTAKHNRNLYVVGFDDTTLRCKPQFPSAELDTEELPPPKNSGTLKDYEKEDRVGVRVSCTHDGRKYKGTVTEITGSNAYLLDFDEIIKRSDNNQHRFTLGELETEQAPPPRNFKPKPTATATTATVTTTKMTKTTTSNSDRGDDSLSNNKKRPRDNPFGFQDEKEGMLASTLADEGGGTAEKKLENWVQCEHSSCMKWRKLPWFVQTDEIPKVSTSGERLRKRASEPFEHPQGQPH